MQELEQLYVYVSENDGSPQLSILIGGFHYKPSILGYPYFLETSIFIWWLPSEPTSLLFRLSNHAFFHGHFPFGHPYQHRFQPPANYWWTTMPYTSRIGHLASILAVLIRPWWRDKQVANNPFYQHFFGGRSLPFSQLLRIPMGIEMIWFTTRVSGFLDSFFLVSWIRAIPNFKTFKKVD